MEQNRFRCHISMVFHRLAGVVVLVGVALLNNIEAVVRLWKEGVVWDEETLWITGAVLLAGVLYTIYYLLVWAKTWICVDEHSIVVEQLTLNRKIHTIGMENVSNVNLTQNLLQRLLGVYVVKLDTNSTTTAENTDVNIVLGKERAFWLRDKVMSRAAKPGGTQSLRERQEQQEQQGRQEQQEQQREKRPALEYSFGALAVRWIFMCNLLAVLVLAACSILPAVMEQPSGLVVLLLWAGIIWNLVSGLIRFYDFRAYRRGNELQISYGLFNRREFQIPVEKISAIRIRQRCLARAAGRSTVELVCIGLGDEKKEGAQLILAEKPEKLVRDMERLLPEFRETLEIGLHRQKSSAWLAMLPGMAVFLAILAAVAAGVTAAEAEWGAYAPLAAGGAGIFYLVCKGLSFGTRRLGIGTGHVVTVSGCFERRMVCIPYQKLQNMKIEQGVIARRLKLCKGELHIWAAALESVYVTGYFPPEQMEQLHRGLLGKTENYCKIRQNRV